jgi:Mg-chelatase subunit ChlD/type II secretory pathway pseudopilin PulG
MNPETPNPSREDIEAKLTALLLGELPAEEAQLLRWAIAQDAALAKLHDRLKLTIGFVREVAATPAEATPAQAAPLKLSGDRREKLLAHFKTVAPQELVPLLPPLRREHFWNKPINIFPKASRLIEVLAVVTIIAVLAAMLLPPLASAKRKAQRVVVTQSDKFTARDAADSAQATGESSPALSAPLSTPPSGAPQLALKQRVAGLEAYVQNGEKPTLTPSPTEIVLPKAQDSFADEKETLAAASPAQTEFFSSVPPSGAPPGGNAINNNSGFAWGAEATTTSGRATQMRASDIDAIVPGYAINGNNSAVATGSTTTSPLTTRAQQTLRTTGGAQMPDELAGRQLQPSSGVNLVWQDNLQDTSAQNLPLPDKAPAVASAASGNIAGGGFGGRGGRGGAGGGGGRGGGGRGGSIPGLAGSAAPTPAIVAAPSAPIVAPSVSEADRTAIFSDGLTREDVSGLRYLTPQNVVAQNQVAVGASEFSRNPAAETAADKEPMLGDVPLMAGQFQNRGEIVGYNLAVNSFDTPVDRTASVGGDIGSPKNLGEEFSKRSAGALVANNSWNGSLSDELSKSDTGAQGSRLAWGSFDGSTNAVAVNDGGNWSVGDWSVGVLEKGAGGTLALNGVNSFQGGTAFNLGVAKDANGNLAYNINGTVGQATISVDPDAHQLVVLADPATEEAIQAKLKSLPPANIAQNAPVNQTQSFFRMVDPSGPAPTVAPPAPAAATDDPLAKLKEQRAQELQSKNLQMKFANPSDMQSAIQSSLTDGRSKVAVDSRTGELAISGTEEEIQSVEKLVSQLDTPTRQVLVESRLSGPTAAPAGVVSGTGALAQNDAGVQGSYRVNGFNQITGYVTNYTVLNTGTPNASIVPTSITPIKSGNVFTNIPPNNVLVTQIIPIENADVQQLVKDISPFVSPQAVIVANSAGNSIVITDTQANIRRLNQMIQAIDSSAASGKKTPPPTAPIPTPEMLTRENAFSTFSLNVSDVSFKLAAASLEKGQLPDAASIRTEEFINAFNYHDPEAKWDSASSLSTSTGKMPVPQPVAFVAERARYPFAHNRDLLRFSIKTAAQGRQAGRPLNIVLLLDNSGSMERADRVAIIHEALKVLAAQLQPQDTLSIVTFARTARLWVDGARGDQAGTAVNKVSDLVPEGGTNLEEAMNLAYATARRHYLANGVNRVVLLTDGAANLGNVNPEALKQKVEAQRKQGIALDCFGIGWEGYNDDLLEQLSSNGDGRYGFINSPEAATTEFAAQLAGALHVAAQDVKVQVEFNPGRVTSYRQIGYAKHQLTKQQFRDNTVDAAEIAAQEAGNALYTVEVNPQGTGPVATVRVRYKVPGTGDYREQAWVVPFDGNPPALEQSSPALRLAATASAFSEWLASSPYAQEVTTDQLLNYLNGVPAIYGADARPKQLETMIREAKSLSGK